MKDFEDIEITKEEPKKYDKYAMQKNSLLLNLTRSKEICDSVYAWLMSFEGGISKEVFMQQISRLDFSDEVALEQLRKSMGRRSIVKKRETLPPLPKIDNAIKELAEGNLFIAVNGREKDIRQFVKSSYKSLKELGRTFVLDMNELRLLWTDKYNMGVSKKICQDALEAEFLIIVGFEAPMDLPNYISDWVNSVRRYRIEKKMPIIAPFARYLESSMFFQYFKKYSA